MLTKKKLSEAMVMLCEMYERQPTKPLLEGYWLVLKHMDEQEFNRSIENILSSRKYASLPKPAEILEYSMPDTDAIAILAIEDIERAISRAGAYRSVTFQDPVINSVVDSLGGWAYVCKMDLDEWKWAKKEIPKLYKVYAKRESHPTHLIGIAERENGVVKEISQVIAGYQLPKPQTVPALNPQANKVTTMLGSAVSNSKMPA